VTPHSNPSERSAAAQDLADFARFLYLQGWMPGTSGNLSVRLQHQQADTALITASGRDKGALTADDSIVIHAISGTPQEVTELKTSAETAIHTAIYDTTDARAVIHVHSPYATAIATRAARGDRTAVVTLSQWELLKGLGLKDAAHTDVPVFRNWAHVPQIADDIRSHLQNQADAAPGLLIAHHGITTWGGDLAQARNRLECLEAIFQLLTLNAALQPADEERPDR